jgi:hypothetical protein
MITSKTVGYIHALIIDTVTRNNSESPYARALRNEQMVTQELDEMDPHKFRFELVKCLAGYYENVRYRCRRSPLCEELQAQVQGP